MQDINLIFKNGRFDVEVDGGDFKSTNGMDTSIIISLFTDARANTNQIALPEYRRGWPGNIVSTIENRQLGGYLYLINQRRLNQDTLDDAVDYARKSLIWMIEDNLLIGVDVVGNIIPRMGIRLEITLTATNGKTESRYYNLWELTGGSSNL